MKPPVNEEVLGWHPAWVDADYNAIGIRICFRHDDEDWTSAVWDNYQDNYHAEFTKGEADRPRYWCFRPPLPQSHAG